MKSQTVRLLDVFFVGPFMIWSASRIQGPDWACQAMLILGVLTILYNGANYLQHEGGSCGG